MHTSPILLIVAAFIATAAMSVPAKSKPAGGNIASKATAEKCKKVGDECLKSPLCQGGITKDACVTRCTNKQSKCLRSDAKAITKEGKGGTQARVPVAKPTVQQPTTTVGTRPIVRPAVQQPATTLGTKSVPIRGGRPAQNRK